jgi:hypothetical protein
VGGRHPQNAPSTKVRRQCGVTACSSWTQTSWDAANRTRHACNMVQVNRALVTCNETALLLVVCPYALVLAATSRKSSRLTPTDTLVQEHMQCHVILSFECHWHCPNKWILDLRLAPRCFCSTQPNSRQRPPSGCGHRLLVMLVWSGICACLLFSARVFDASIADL